MSSAISDLLRSLADKLDTITSGETSDPYGVNQNNKAARAPVDPADYEKETPLDTYTPPLQQKLELLKRSVGIENAFDDTPIDKCANGGEDELELIKRHAGISPNTAAIMTLADDEPLDM